MNKTSTVLSLALLSATPSLLAADLTGKVTLKGTPPPPAQQPMKENMCGNPEAYVIKSRQFVVGKDSGLAGVFVYLKSGSGVDAKKFAPTGDKPVLDQIHCEYQPYTFGVLAGQTFTVKRGQSTRVTFVADKPGIHGIVCSQHQPSMTGELIVLAK